MGEEFNPYYKWLAIPLDEQPPNHYRLLGVTPFESAADVIANAADQRMAFLRTFQTGPKSALSQKLLNEIAAARLVLLDPKRKVPYDDALRTDLGARRAAALTAPPVAPPPPSAVSHPVAPPPAAPYAPAVTYAAGAVAPPVAAPPGVAPPPRLVSPPAASGRSSGEFRPIPVAQPTQMPEPMPAAESRYDIALRPEKSERSRPAPPKKNHLLIVPAVIGVLAVVLVVVLVAGRDRSKPELALNDHSTASGTPNQQAGPAPDDEPSSAEPATPPRHSKKRRPVAPLDPEETSPEPEPRTNKPGETESPSSQTSIVPPPQPEPPSTPPGKPTPPVEPKPVEPKPVEPKPAVPDTPPADPVPMPRADTHPGEPSAADHRLAEPAADTMTAANQQIKEVYRQEFADATTPGLKRHLAETLLKQAETAGDEVPIRFGLFQSALHLATEAADVGVALEVIDALAAAFVVDPHALRLQALQQMSKTAKPADQLSVGKAALEQVHRATQADELAVAEKLAQLAQNVATKTRDVDLRKASAARLADVKKVEHLWNQARAAADQLKQDPQDEAANLTYGSYLCLTHGDWAQGLPLLAKGTAGKLSAAARLDLQPAPDAAAQIQVGDAWWNLAGDDKSVGKPLLLERAGHWYQQALPQLTGLTQTRIEKRLGEIATHTHEEPLGRKAPTLTAGKQLDVPLGAGDGATVLHLRWMPAGKFIQGSPANEPGHQPFESQHEVVLTRPFFIGTTEVTQAQWQAVMGNNPSRFTGPDVPVHNVTYTAAKEFCERLDLLPSTRGKYQFRLPTSAEWEYACRAGSKRTYCFGDDPGKLGEFAWYKDSTKGVGGPRPVAQLKPNAAGLYDMHGNVSEWCTDSFSNLVLTTRQIDPKGFPGVNQVTRGGYGMSSAEECRCAHIFNDPPGKAIDGLGFRVICDPVAAKKDAR